MSSCSEVTEGGGRVYTGLWGRGLILVCFYAPRNEVRGGGVRRGYIYNVTFLCVFFLSRVQNELLMTHRGEIESDQG